MKLPPEHVEKLRNERNVPASAIEGLIKKLEMCPDPQAAQTCFDEFCGTNRLRGDPVSLEPSEKVGRLAYKAAFSRRLTRSLLKKGHVFDEAGVEDLLDCLFDLGSPYEQRELTACLLDMAGDIPITGVTLSDARESYLATLTWLFRHPQRSKVNSRDGLDGAKLPHRLGLNAQSGDQYLGFDVDASHVKSARLPTVFDISWSQLPVFLPGGRTLPTAGYPATDGLEETVAIPPHLSSIHGSPVGIVAE